MAQVIQEGMGQGGQPLPGRLSFMQGQRWMLLEKSGSGGLAHGLIHPSDDRNTAYRTSACQFLHLLNKQLLCYLLFRRGGGHGCRGKMIKQILERY